MTQTDPQIATETRGGAGRGLLAAASGAFLAERERWFLWLPVAFGTGVALYFALLSEPPLWLGIAGLGVGLVVTFIARAHAFGRWTGFALAGIAAGFLVAQYRAAEVEAPMLFQEIGPGQVTGRVLEARPVRGGKRLLLEQVAIEGLDADATPERVRVTLRKGGRSDHPGCLGRSLGGLVAAVRAGRSRRLRFCPTRLFRAARRLGLRPRSGAPDRTAGGRDGRRLASLVE